MVKINKLLLPIKGHYFLYALGMRHFMSTFPKLGHKIGIPFHLIAKIYFISHLFELIGKPTFGIFADRCVRLRKHILFVLILLITLIYGVSLFIPIKPDLTSELNEPPLNITFNFVDVRPCRENLIFLGSNDAPIRYNCSALGTTFYAYIADEELKTHFNLTSNIASTPSIHMCVFPETLEKLLNRTAFDDFGKIDASCSQYASVYGSWRFWMFAIIMCGGFIMFGGTDCISHSICFDMLGKSREYKFGAQYLWGSIGFGLAAVIFYLLETYAMIDSFITILVAMFLFNILDLLNVVQIQHPNMPSTQTICKDVFKLLTRPSVAIFMVFVGLIGIIYFLLISSIYFRIREIFSDHSYRWHMDFINTALLVGRSLFGDVPILIFSGKIIKKLGYANCLSVALFFFTVRLALIALIPNFWALMAIEMIFHGCSYSLSYVCIVGYAAAIAPPGTTATLIGIVALLYDGLGLLSRELFAGSGLLYEQTGRAFAFFAIFSTIVFIAHILIRYFVKQYLPETNGYQLPQEQYGAIYMSNNTEAQSSRDRQMIDMQKYPRQDNGLES